MNKLSVISSILLPLIFICSCQKELDFEGDKIPPRTVVNSVFSSDHPWNVEISQTKSVLSNEDNVTMDDAEVTISNGFGWSERLLNKGNGLYYSKFSTPRPGVEYYISVKDPDGNSMSATNKVPVQPKLTDVRQETYVSSDGTERYRVYLSFQDPPGEDNYYNISFYYLNILGEVSDILENGLSDTSYGIIPVPTLYVNDPDLNSIVRLNSGFSVDKGQNWYPSIKGVYFTDEFFDGQFVTLEFEMDPDDVSQFLDNTGGILVDSYLFYAMNFLSEDYFLYNTTLDKQVSSKGDPTAQPVKVYSNIHNGLGVFAGYSSVSDSIKINK
ncbi:MAG: DUF4249 domain-containing protein [Flavobacteriales bacterium]|nr:DUF4249 domain-containing protein [Flavobacteriales bacterium]